MVYKFKLLKIRPRVVEQNGRLNVEKAVHGTNIYMGDCLLLQAWLGNSARLDINQLFTGDWSVTVVSNVK